MSWKRHIRGINGQERMDKQQPPVDPTPPDIRGKRRRWRSRFECFVRKGDHQYELVKASHVRGVENVMSVQEYYAYRDQKVEEDRARMAEENKIRVANGLAERLYWLPSKWRYYRCVHCGHREYDYEDKPKDRVREKLIGE